MSSEAFSWLALAAAIIALGIAVGYLLYGSVT